MYRYLVSALSDLSWEPERHLEDHLVNEAMIIERMLSALLARTNSVQQPELYARLNRIHRLADRRHRRRRISASIAFYRRRGCGVTQVPSDHVYYEHIIRALS